MATDDHSSGGKPRPAPQAQPEQRWQPKGGFSVMKPIAPLPEAAPPPPPVLRQSLDPVAPTPRPPPPQTSTTARRPIQSLDPVEPSPGAAGADAPVFVPAWETSASRAAAAAAEAADQAAIDAAMAAREAKPPPEKEAKNPVVRQLRASQRIGVRVTFALIAVVVLGAAGVGIYATVGAEARAAGPPIDSAITARQRALTATGNAQRDPLKAIVAYDEAIALAPRGPGARDALLGRARKYIDIGELDSATADVNMLRQRGDTGPVSAELDALIARLKQKRP